MVQLPLENGREYPSRGILNTILGTAGTILKRKNQGKLSVRKVGTLEYLIELIY